MLTYGCYISVAYRYPWTSLGKVFAVRSTAMPVVSENRSPCFSTRRLFLDFHQFPALLHMHRIISVVEYPDRVSSLVSHRANALRSQEQGVAQSLL